MSDITAWTAPGASLPAFVNFSEADDGGILVTLRADNSPTSMMTVRVPLRDFVRMVGDLAARFLP